MITIEYAKLNTLSAFSIYSFVVLITQTRTFEKQSGLQFAVKLRNNDAQKCTGSYLKLFA